jgi:protein phosphatase
VADEHLAKPVRCHVCGKAFTARPPTGVVLPSTNPPPAPPPGPPRLHIGSATSPGRVRPHNEDSFLVRHQAWSNGDQRHEIALLVVADGMGGHEAGDRASGRAIRSLGTALTPLLEGALNGQFKEPAPNILSESIDFAIREANRSIYRKAKADPACAGMGATAAVLLIWNGQLVIGHVGDCRVYHHRGNRLTQVTTDQTLVARMVELGRLTPEEARAHPAANEVTQAVGGRFDITPAPYQLTLERGDWVIAACDGLHAHVAADTLQQEIGKSARSASHLAQHLVRLADERGGSDNCTVIAVYCD